MIINTIKKIWWATIIFSTACNNPNSSRLFENRSDYYNTFGRNDSITNLRTDNITKFAISVPDDITKNQIRLDTIFESRKIVQLESNEDCMIRHVDEIFVSKNRIIITDKTREQVAFIFSIEGEYISQIGRKGNGPDEYLSLRDIAINYLTDEIILYDGKGGKLMFYNENGKFIKKKKTFIYADNFAVLNDNCFAYHQLDNINKHISRIQNYQIIITDSTQKIISKAFSYNYPQRKEKLDIYNLFDFNTSNNTLYFNPLYTNCIYKITNSSTVSLEYVLSLKEKDVLNRLNEFNSNDDYIKALNVNRLWKFSGILLEANNWAYTKIKNAGIIYYNKENNKMIYGSSFSYVRSIFDSDQNHIKYNRGFFENTISANDSFFIGYVWPYQLFGRDIEPKTRAFQGLNRPVSFDDNPILQFYKLK